MRFLFVIYSAIPTYYAAAVYYAAPPTMRSSPTSFNAISTDYAVFSIRVLLIMPFLLYVPA